MTNETYLRSRDLLAARSSQLVIVDLQEKLLPAIDARDALLANCVKLIRAAQIFDVSVSCTEQYPRGLGSTVGAIGDLVPDRREKLRFSSAETLNLCVEAGTVDARHQIVIAGIEAHICVLQTAFDLMSQGFEVFVVADAISSRNSFDKDIAIRRMSDSGIRIVTTEMVLFEWCEVAGTDQFKQVSRLVKDPDSTSRS